MVKYTENYSLRKPEGFENFSVLPYNENMDILDTKIKSLETMPSEIQQQLTAHLDEVTWENATLLNGWESFGVGYEPKYALDKHRYLIFKGAMKNGTLTKGTTLFTVSESMRPNIYVHMVTSCNNQSFNPYEYKIIELSLTPDGRVVLGSTIPYAQFLNLDGISIKL